MIFQRYNHLGTQALGIIKVVDGNYEQGVDGADNLSISCIGELNKGELLRWRDADGDDHEHLVSESRVSHTSGVAVSNATCINSIANLYGVPLPEEAPWGPPQEQITEDLEPGQFICSLKPFIDALLAGTIWSLGTITSLTGDDITYGISDITIEAKDDVRTVLTKVIEGYTPSTGGKLMMQTVFTDNGDGTTSHVINLKVVDTTSNNTPSATPVRRFTFGKNVAGVERNVDGSTLYSAVKAQGAEDGTGVPITDYVTGTDDQKNAYGYVDNNGVVQHSVAFYEDAECDSQTELHTKALAYLKEVSTPKVTYTCTLQAVEGVKVGDYVDVIDTGFTPEVRIRAVVSSISYKLLDRYRTGKVVIGNSSNAMQEAASKAHSADRATKGTDSYNDVAKLNDKVGFSDYASTSGTGVIKPDGTTTTVDSDGTLHAAGGSGSNRYIDGVTNGVGIFNPDLADANADVFELRSYVSSSVQRYLSFLMRSAGTLKKIFMSATHLPGTTPTSKIMLRPPADDDDGSKSMSLNAADGSYLELSTRGTGSTQTGSVDLTSGYIRENSSSHGRAGIKTTGNGNVYIGYEDNSALNENVNGISILRYEHNVSGNRSGMDIQSCGYTIGIRDFDPDASAGVSGLYIWTPGTTGAEDIYVNSNKLLTDVDELDIKDWVTQNFQHL